MTIRSGCRRTVAELAALAAMAFPAAAAGQAPAGDSITGSGASAGFEDFKFNVTSGPVGQSPTGHTHIVFMGLVYDYDIRPRSCLVVTGHKATLAGPIPPNPGGFTYGKVSVVDSPEGDTFAAEGFNAKVDCSTYTTFDQGRVTSGDVTVTDAPAPPGVPPPVEPGPPTPSPPPTPKPKPKPKPHHPHHHRAVAPPSPFPPGHRVLGLGDAPLRATRSGTVRPRMTCRKPRGACRGRLVGLLRGGGRTFPAPFFIAAGRTATVALGLHRRQLRIAERRRRVATRIVAVRHGRAIGQAAVLITARRHARR